MRLVFSRIVSQSSAVHFCLLPRICLLLFSLLQRYLFYTIFLSMLMTNGIFNLRARRMRMLWRIRKKDLFMRWLEMKVLEISFCDTFAIRVVPNANDY